jgi:uncharacterized protein YjbI with pentapeptide repeats
MENVSDSKIIDSSHLDKWVLKERWGKDFSEVKSNLQTLLPNTEINVEWPYLFPTEAQDLPPILDRSAALLDFKSRDGEDISINDTRLQSIRASAQGLEDTLEKYPNLRDTIASVTFNYENAASGQLGSTTAAFELEFEVDAQIGRVMLTDPETGEFNSGIRRTDDGFAIWPMSEYPDNEKEKTAIFQPLVDRREDIINSSYLTVVHEMGHIATFGQEYSEGFQRVKEQIDNSDLGNKEMPTTIPQRMDDVMNNNARGFDSVSEYASTLTSETIAEGVAYSHLYAMNDGKNMPFDDPNAKESAALMGASDGTRYYVAPAYQDPFSPNPIVAWVSKESLAEAEEIRELHHNFGKAVEAEKDSSISISSLAASASPYQEIFKLIYAPPAIGSVQAAVENNNWDLLFTSLTAAYNPDQERDENGRWSSGGSSENKEIEKIVKAVKDNEGYSVKPLTGEVPKDGYMVAVPNTSQTMPAEDFFSEKGIQAVANEIKDFIESNEAAFDGGAWLGLWHAKADGIIVFDVVDQIASRSEAIQQGIARDQISIYDVVNEVEIQTGGTGGLTASGQTRSFRNPTGQEMVGNDLGRKKRVDSENSRAFRGGSKQSLAFDPDQPRDADGKWGSGGGSAPEPKTGKVDPSEIKPGADLSGRDLSGMDLYGMDLTGVNLSGAELYGANLRNAKLEDAILRDANLTNADLRNASLKNADLNYAYLTNAKLEDANLRNANLNGADLEDANLSGATLIDATLTNANLRDADLGGARLTSANLSATDLSSADLHGADLSYTNLTDANLSYANLTQANLSMSKLEGTDLSYADLTSARLIMTSLTDADLRYANLTGADLQDATVTDVNFTGANLTGTDFKDAIVTNADFTDAIVTGSNLFLTNLDSVTLSPEQKQTIQESKGSGLIAIEGVSSAIGEELGKKDIALKDIDYDDSDYEAKIYNADDDYLGRISFSVNEGILDLGLIQLEAEFQDLGTAETIQLAVMAEAFDPENGIDFVAFHANIDIGGYAWAKAAYPTEESWENVKDFVSGQIDYMKQTDEGEDIDFSNVEKALASDDPRAIQIIHDDKTILPDDLVSKSTKGNELGRELLLDSDWYAILPTDQKTLASAQSRLAASGAVDKSSWMPNVPERDLSEWLPWPCYVNKDGSVTDEGIWENLGEEDFSDVKRTKDFSYWPITLAFNPDQERDENGKWTSGGDEPSYTVSAKTFTAAIETYSKDELTKRWGTSIKDLKNNLSTLLPKANIKASLPNANSKARSNAQGGLSDDYFKDGETVVPTQEIRLLAMQGIAQGIEDVVLLQPNLAEQITEVNMFSRFSDSGGGVLGYTTSTNGLAFNIESQMSRLLEATDYSSDWSKEKEDGFISIAFTVASHEMGHIATNSAAYESLFATPPLVGPRADGYGELAAGATTKMLEDFSETLAKDFPVVSKYAATSADERISEAFALNSLLQKTTDSGAPKNNAAEPVNNLLKSISSNTTYYVAPSYKSDVDGNILYVSRDSLLEAERASLAGKE